MDGFSAGGGPGSQSMKKARPGGGVPVDEARVEGVWLPPQAGGGPAEAAHQALGALQGPAPALRRHAFRGAAPASHATETQSHGPGLHPARGDEQPRRAGRRRRSPDISTVTTQTKPTKPARVT